MWKKAGKKSVTNNKKEISIYVILVENVQAAPHLGNKNLSGVTNEQ